MTNLFQYTFIQNAFLAGIVASITCGIIGSLIVSKRIVSLCGGIAHASFGGIGLSYLLNLNPSLGALIFAILTSLGIGTLSKKTKHPEDTSIALFWAVGMSLGLIFMSIKKGYSPDLMTYLFGNILTVTRPELLSLLILDSIVIGFMAILYKEILAVCFDEEFAFVRGIPVFKLYLLILILVALAVVVLMKIVGIILVMALLSVPAAISKSFTRSLKTMMVMAVFLNMVFILLGLFISYWLNSPSGATIILVATISFLISEIIKKRNHFLTTARISRIGSKPSN